MTPFLQTLSRQINAEIAQTFANNQIMNHQMQIVERIAEVRRLRWQDPTATWGLVPTMGYLHEGHLSLVRRAKAENDYVAVTIFVNPTQFDEAADLTKYPRNLERDLALLAAEGVDMVWTPTPEIVYPPHFQTAVSVADI